MLLRQKGFAVNLSTLALECHLGIYPFGKCEYYSAPEEGNGLGKMLTSTPLYIEILPLGQNKMLLLPQATQ